MDPEQVKAAFAALENKDYEAASEILKALIIAAASGNAPPAGGAPALDPLAANAEPEPTPEEQALETALTVLTSATGPAERVVFLNSLIAERTKHAEQIAALELISRLELVGELVKLSVEVPSTAFMGDPKDRKLFPRLANEPLADLRARVGVLKATKGGAQHTPPARGGEVLTLSAVDAAAAKKAGMTAEQFTAAKKNAVKRA